MSTACWKPLFRRIHAQFRACVLFGCGALFPFASPGRAATLTIAVETRRKASSNGAPSAARSGST